MVTWTGWYQNLTVILENSLFQGRSGIAIFFAILAKETGKERFYLAMKDTIGKVVSDVKDQKNYLYSTQGIGALDGAFGQIYALTVIAKIFGIDDYIEIITNSLSYVDADMLHKDEKLDFVSGVAGVLLTLTSVADMSNNQTVSKLIDSCCERILDKQVNLEVGCAWRTSNDRILTGLSHGVSGIVAALASAHKINPDSSLKSAILGAVSYETSQFNHDIQNWPDQRYDKTRFSIGWSHGAPGIGLSRLSMASLDFVDPSIEVDMVSSAIYNFKGEVFDYIVSGKASHIAFFNQCKKTPFNNPQQQKFKNKLICELLSDFNDNRAFHLPFKQNRIMANPSLFTGISGIGLCLLQACTGFDSNLPSVWVLD